jgi:putative copper resistance protein D
VDLAGLAAARFASYLPLLAVAGLPLHAWTDRRARLSRGERWALVLLALAAMAASAWWALVDVAAMTDLAIGMLDRATLATVLGATPLGTVLAVRTAALAALLAALAWRPTPAACAPPALLALATVAATGHAGAGEGVAGFVLQAGDALHLAAAALWIGALVALLASLREGAPAPDALRSLARFARTGSVVVTLLLATGLANAWFIGGPFAWPPPSPRGTWPLLIAAKVVLFVAMSGFAANNRWRLVPAMRRGAGADRTRLRRSLALETACAVAVVAIVAVGGLLDPHGG